jgi:hypothetical protein
MDKVVHLFRWDLLGYIAQPFTTEYLFYVDMDRRLFDNDEFSPHRVLVYMFFRKFLHHRILKRRFIIQHNQDHGNDE